MTKETQELTDEQKKFAIIKTLDKWRWEITPKEVLEGYKRYCFYDDLKGCLVFNNEGKIKVNNITKELAEKVLLTHHLLYICNRQMDARRIFSEGAEVISNIVEDYKSKKDFDLDNYIGNKNDKKQETDTIDTEEDEQKSYCLEFEDKQFASRYMLTDIACMLKTFNNLNTKTEEFNPEGKEENRIIDEEGYQNFSEFLGKFSSSSITTLAQALYELTYQGVPVIKNSDVENEKDKVGKIVDILSENVRDKVLTKARKQLSSSYKFEKKKHNLKRVWCEVRDYLYDPVLKECFKIIVGENNFKTLKRKDNVSSLELPGDVWNNNSTFAECFWGETYGNASEFVRKKFEEDGGEDCWDGCFPHNFDITFNFVPRMCESNNCSMCPIFKNENNENNEDKKGEDWENLCHKKKEAYCSFALYATGVKHVCKGEKDKDGCEILKIMNENSKQVKKIPTKIHKTLS